jgi:hypothetical protein
MKLVAETLRDIAAFAKSDRPAFVERVRETLSEKQTEEIKAQAKRLSAGEKRLAELGMLYKKIYEDNALGKLPDKQFAALSEGYVAEQETLEKEVAELRASAGKYESDGKGAERFMELVERYENFSELSVTMLNECVEKIVVHERDRKGARDTTQTVEIYFNFIGGFEIPKEEIDPAELAAMDEERRKKEARRDRLHQNYLRRKESGKQQEYDRRQHEKRKAERGAGQAIIIT